jgi:hypothetical protein
MPPLHLSKIALTLVLQVSEDVLDRYLPASAQVVGEELAREVSEHVRAEKLGYYPALDYFQSQGGVEKSLLEAAEHISWLVATLVRDEIRKRLRPVFSSVSIQAVQPVAFTMPPVRPNQPNAHVALTKHYTPDTVKVNLLVTLFQKVEAEEGLEKLADHMLWRWLKDVFESVEVTSAQLV